MCLWIAFEKVRSGDVAVTERERTDIDDEELDDVDETETTEQEDTESTEHNALLGVMGEEEDVAQ